MHNTFVWNELMTRDPAAATAFYGALLGWTYDTMATESGADYWVARLGDRPVAGIIDMNGPDFTHLPPHWFSYIEVDDVNARVAKAETAGAKILRPPFEVPDVGRIAILEDPTGAAVGWMTSAPPS